MSIAATMYAVEYLENDRTLSPSARAILLAAAVRANVKTAETYTGAWLCRVANVNDRNVRYHLHALRDAGAIKLSERPGKASVIGFPVGGVLALVDDAPEATPPPRRRRTAPPGRTDASGQFHPAICACGECVTMHYGVALPGAPGAR